MSDSIIADIRAELKRRVLDGESMYSLAAESGIDRASLSRFKRGLRELSVENLDRLAHFLRLRITDEPAPQVSPRRRR